VSRRVRVGPAGERGASMLEFALVAPLLLAVGLLAVQWALLFHARNVANHAAFMAARAGATTHARPEAIREAYARALAPLHGGGRTLAEVEAAAARAATDVADSVRIEILNPTVESFDDWADPALQARLGTGARAIPNDGLSLLDPGEAARIGPRSGQTRHDANVLKLRVTHGAEPRVPLAAAIVRTAARLADDGRDAFASALLARGRLPLRFDVTVRMQSAPIESAATASLGRVAAGTPGRPDCGLGPCPPIPAPAAGQGQPPFPGLSPAVRRDGAGAGAGMTLRVEGEPRRPSAAADVPGDTLDDCTATDGRCPFCPVPG
jgi:hypothetical protein